MTTFEQASGPIAENGESDTLPGNGAAAASRAPAPRRPPVWRLPLLLALLVALATVAGVSWYRRHLERSPRRCFERALAAIDAAEWAAVEREFLSIQHVQDFEAEVHFLSGAMLLQAGEPTRALEELSYCKNNEQLRIRTLTLAGRALYQLGNLSASEQLLTQAVAIDSLAVDAYRLLGAIYYDLGATNDAALALQRVSELAPRDPRPDRLLGLMNKDYERYLEAAEHYREALARLEAGPSEGKLQLDGRLKPLAFPSEYREIILLELAESEVKQMRFAEALASLADCSPSPTREVLRAECLMNLGPSGEVGGILDRVLREHPDYVPALVLHGSFALKSGDAAGALESLRHAAMLRPRDYTTRFKLMQAYRKSGDDVQADKQAKIAEELKKQRLEFAELHEQAASEPTNAQVRFQLGVLAEKLDLGEMAITWHKAALALDPNHAGAQRKLREFLRKTP